MSDPTGGGCEGSVLILEATGFSSIEELAAAIYGQYGSRKGPNEAWLDLLHQSMLVLLQALRDGRKFPGQSPQEKREKTLAFVGTTLRNLWLKDLRSSRTREKHAQSVGRHAANKRAGLDNPLAFLPHGDAMLHVACGEAWDALEEADQQIVVLRVYIGLRWKVIGDLLDAPVGTLRSRFSRAVRTMRCVIEEGYELEHLHGTIPVIVAKKQRSKR